MGNDLDNSPTVQITGTIMVIAIIVLFVVVVFVLFLHLYAKWFWWRVEDPPAAPDGRRIRRRRGRFVFTPGQEQQVGRGLDVCVLSSLPVVVMGAKDMKDGLECAVCLCEVREGEKTRLLPKCNHGFHVECIDMWFQSHSTCPLCRSSVASQDSIAAPAAATATTNNNHDLVEINIIGSPQQINLPSAYPSDFPTNVLFWGDHSQVISGAGGGAAATASTSSTSSLGATTSSSSSNRQEGVLRINVAEETSENFAEEESKSSMPTRLRSLKRMLSRERRVAPSTSETSADV